MREDDLLETLLGSADLAADYRAGDEDARLGVVEEAYADLPPSQVLPRLVVLQQLEGSWPHVARTARRLLEEGLDAEQVMVQLSLATAEVLRTATEAFDGAAYDARLDRLPLPDFDIVVASLRRIAAQATVLPSEELVRRAAAELGLDADDPGDVRLVEFAEERLADVAGPLVWLQPDQTASMEGMSADMVLTHELTASELLAGVLDLSFDLAGFAWAQADLPAREELDAEDTWSACLHDRDDLHLHGPEGWLEGFTEATVLAVRLGSGDLPLDLEALSDAPSPRPALVEAVRAAHERDVAGNQLPAEAAAVLAAARLEDPEAFTTPEAPLQALCEAAGLDVRGGRVAGAAAIWRADARLEVLREMVGRADDEDLAAVAVGVVGNCDKLVAGEATGDQLEAALMGLAEPAVLTLVEEPLLRGPEPHALVDILLEGARRGPHLAVARYLAARLAEDDEDVLAAEQHLELAHEAAARFWPAAERLAWYASDRGDAARALRLLRGAPSTPTVRADRDELERFVAGSSELPRNAPCWCGSGRKYKRCHMGVAAQAPLPDRVRWLWHKATAFVQRGGAEVSDEWFAVVAAKLSAAGSMPSDPDGTVDALMDPLVMDVALVEGGLFEWFLDERGVLLPDDEALLAASWVTVERTVYEVTATDPGERLTLRDLRTGDVVEVRERSLSREATPGLLVCARAVPDGETHQLVGAPMTVPPGREAALLDVLDEGDADEVIGWFAAFGRPPTLQNREGEALVAVELELRVADVPAVRAHLDEAYDPDEPGRVWLERHELGGDEALLRARLELDGDLVRVATNSDERADRILRRLEAVTTVEVEADQRQPIKGPQDMMSLARIASGEGPPEGLGDEPSAELQAQVRDHLERRWCEEPVPALGGLTPREAAEDPTRRDELRRLLDSFDDVPAPEGMLLMRPGRLRELLDL